MTQEVTLTISDKLFQQASRIAQAQKKLVAEVLVEAIVLDDDERERSDGLAEVEQEKSAYRALHGWLWQNYPDEHVAIYQGQLVDHDPDGLTLSRRIYKRFPDEFVLIRQVEAEPERILYFRSPRFALQANGTHL